MGDRVQSSRRKVSHRYRAGSGVEPFGGCPPTAIPGSHLQLAAFGFHSGLRVSAHRRLSAATFMEKEVHSPFHPGLAESAPRPNLRAWDAGQPDTEYRRLRGFGPRGCEPTETSLGIGDPLHRCGLAYAPTLRLPSEMANLQAGAPSAPRGWGWGLGMWLCYFQGAPGSHWNWTPSFDFGVSPMSRCRVLALTVWPEIRA